jgi:hypothetical protein
MLKIIGDEGNKQRESVWIPLKAKRFAAMKVVARFAIALFIFEFIRKLSARQTQVIINLTEQTAYLLEDGQLAFVSPIASGKPGWGTPTGPRGRFRSIN